MASSHSFEAGPSLGRFFDVFGKDFIPITAFDQALSGYIQ